MKYVFDWGWIHHFKLSPFFEFCFSENLFYSTTFTCRHVIELNQRRYAFFFCHFYISYMIEWCSEIPQGVSKFWVTISLCNIIFFKLNHYIRILYGFISHPHVVFLKYIYFYSTNKKKSSHFDKMKTEGHLDRKMDSDKGDILVLFFLLQLL